MTTSDKNATMGWRPPSLAELELMPVSTYVPDGETHDDAREADEDTPDHIAAVAEEGYANDSPLQQLVRTRKDAAGCLLRTLVAEEGQVSAAAVVMVALGQDMAGELIATLEEAPRRELVRAIATLDVVDAASRRAAADTFTRRLNDEDFSLRGGMEFAREILERIAGRHEAQEMLDLITGDRSSGFAMFKDLAPEQMAPFISHEHPQTIALILSQINPAQGAGVLSHLPSATQADVAYRVATMENITPRVLFDMERALEASLRDVLGGNQDVGGPKVVADILNCTGSSVEANVLNQMDGQDPGVAEAVRNLMFTFNDISKLSDRELQILLREVDQKDLVVALKAVEEEFKEKVLSNLSERVRQFIKEEMEFLGPMRLSEVEEVQLRIVQQVRQLEEQGQVTIVRGVAADQFV